MAKVAGISKSSLAFTKYDQVNKDKTYSLSENLEDEFDDNFAVRIVDFRLFHSDPKRFATELGSAMEEIGFVILSNHGLDNDLIGGQADEMVADLFEQNSLEHKMRFEATDRYGSVKAGYMPFKETSDIHPDLVEGWVFTRNTFNVSQPQPQQQLVDEEAFDTTRFWPNRKYEKFFRSVLLEETKLILPIMQSILTYLKAPDPHMYDDRLHNNSAALRLNYYPSISDADAQAGGGRMLGHEDVTVLTFIPAPKVEGLQVLNRKNGKWIRVKAPPGSIIMNTGDYLQRVSNDILPSTTHRVSRPRSSDDQKRSRISVVMGVYFHHTEHLSVMPHLPHPKYDPVQCITERRFDVHMCSVKDMYKS